jgi:hypothetical protein
MKSRTISEEMHLKQHADPLIHIGDDLYEVISMLRTVAMALGNDEGVDTYGLKDCRHCVEFAADRVRKVQEITHAALDEFYRGVAAKG